MKVKKHEETLRQFLIRSAYKSDYVVVSFTDMEKEHAFGDVIQFEGKGNFNQKQIGKAVHAALKAFAEALTK
jgi:hypothetical protein